MDTVHVEMTAVIRALWGISAHNGPLCAVLIFQGLKAEVHLPFFV